MEKSSALQYQLSGLFACNVKTKALPLIPYMPAFCLTLQSSFADEIKSELYMSF